MKRLLPVIASLVLASGIGAASAADHSAMSRHSSMSNSTRSMATDNLSLTSSQRKLAWSDIRNQGSSQRTPSGFVPSVGSTVPGDIALKPVPAKLSRQVSALKPYDYVLLSHNLLIVNPTDKKIVEVISSRA